MPNDFQFGRCLLGGEADQLGDLVLCLRDPVGDQLTEPGLHGPAILVGEECQQFADLGEGQAEGFGPG
ncbi:MAG TPA: hypothetical protein VE569_08155 [Acidimicrobiia bacterium]|jgi:hypothetical protein|nr:hypothetical protein [Acidimicrobiia bacterium]